MTESREVAPEQLEGPAHEQRDRRQEPLSEVELAILDLERHRWKYPGAKDACILEQFGMSPTRYYQVLNALIDKPAAEAAAPVTVHRLRRLREERRRRR